MIKLNPFQQLKRWNHNQMKKILLALGKTKRSKFLALTEINLGLSKKKAQEYLQTLINGEHVISEGAFVYVNESKSKEMNDNHDNYSHSLFESNEEKGGDTVISPL